MLKKNKNILIFLSIGIVLIVSIFFSFDKKEYHELPKVKLKGDINKSGLAIMVESDYQTGEYKKLDSNTFPTDGYTLNRIKSGCVDKNGKEIDALIYNENNKTISIKTKQSVYCYLYYDNLFKGLGTEEEPYQINYIEDLVRLSNSTNKNQNTYKSKYFILTRNLDFNENESYMKYNDTGFGDINGVNNIEGIKDELTNQEGTGFMPIGFTQYFEGNFDGNNKRLDNLYIHNKTDINKYYGFIAYLNNGSIKNITMSGEVLTDVNTPLGGIINRIANSTMDNCINEINVTSIGNAYAIGGLISWSSANATITNSVNKGNVTNGGYTAGIIAGNQGGILTIENSHNEGRIINEVGNYAGGLVGRDNADTSKTIIKNSYNAGEVTNAKYSEGGLVGNIFGTTEIENSHNEGKISSTLATYIGGLIGYGDSTANIKINNSYNENVIEVNNNNSLIFVGGLVSRINGICKITNSYNSGNIIGGSRIGGLVGIVQGSTANLLVNNCYNLGNLTTNQNNDLIKHIGGLVMQVYGNAKLYLLNSYNAGNITEQDFKFDKGGLIANIMENSSAIILNSYNSGSVIGKYTDSYGICSHITGNNSIINNVFNVGYLESPNNYGIVRIEGNVDLKNAYYLENNTPKGTTLANDSELTTKMSESDMKNTTFVDILNKNVDELNNAGLETIDENLKEYELERWKQGDNGYPTLDYKLETE